jgi:hypothetical protein
MNEEAVDGQEAVAEDVTETEEVEVETPRTHGRTGSRGPRR